MIKTTKAQRKALHKVWLRIVVRPGHDASNDNCPRNADSRNECCACTGRRAQPTYRDFRETVLPGTDCIMVPFAGMWLGIEPDGYTHS